MDLTIAALKRNLDILDAETPGEWRVVTGDVRNHEVPGDRQHLNTNASWIVGPKSRSRLGAERARQALLALFDLIRASGPPASGNEEMRDEKPRRTPDLPGLPLENAENHGLL